MEKKETKEMQFALLYKCIRLFDVEQLFMSQSISNVLSDLFFALFLVIVYVSCATHLSRHQTEVLGFLWTCFYTKLLQVLLAL